MEGVNITMKNIKKIWGALVNQSLAMQTKQATNKGEFAAAINVLHRQMESVRQDLEETNNPLDNHQANLVKHSSQID